ncbi:MAG TPA: hypothetical protein VFQ85_12930 [Mycobacteriales bacterium]|jgi:hypothetical protein|nr:hypothetical protein [Mycobacteriales bacterium]
MRLSTRTATLLATAAVTAAPMVAHASPTTDARIVGVGVGSTYQVEGVSSPTVAAQQYAATHLGTIVVDVSLAGGQVAITNVSDQSRTFSSTLFATVIVSPGATVTVTVTASAGACAAVTASGSSVQVCVI